MIHPFIMVDRTPSGDLSVAALHGDNALVIITSDNAQALTELIAWALTPQAAEALLSELQKPGAIPTQSTPEEVRRIRP